MAYLFDLPIFKRRLSPDEGAVSYAQAVQGAACMQSLPASLSKTTFLPDISNAFAEICSAQGRAGA